MGMGMGIGKNMAKVQAKPNPPAFTTKPVVGGTNVRASGNGGKPVRQSILGLSKAEMTKLSKEEVADIDDADL